MRAFGRIISIAAVLVSVAGMAAAADIRVLSVGAVQNAVRPLAVDFSKETGHKIVFTVGSPAVVAQKLKDGETFDAVRRRNTALGLTLAAVFVALFVHSLFYSGFFEDPITWVAVALAASFLVYNGAVSEAPGILARWRSRRTSSHGRSNKAN